MQRTVLEQNGILGRSQHQHCRGTGLATVSQRLPRKSTAKVLPGIQIVEVAQSRHVDEAPRCRVGIARLEFPPGGHDEAGGADDHACEFGNELDIECELTNNPDNTQGVFQRV